ncbi:alpha/beta hydrolase [Phycicoccus sp.]|uniref:alpha/beta hydrolase family protein n=1 Tax=Phycicoccus sp. TaxID=1902410 RepID=UPI002BE42EE4|nr:alpha/beta hydrolase [Phycicoccus sp.]HMM93875.1 alpha/beta hydrolase [Phycicoccus sp.]
MTAGRRAAGLVSRTALVACALLAACTPGGDPGVRVLPAHDYRPGLQATAHLPVRTGPAPVVVLVPGGGWVSADPSGLAGLAEHLAAAGAVAVPVEIRAARDGVVWPTPVEDVLCALADAAVTSREAGIEPTALVLLGHSSGAHLAALAALAPHDVHPVCADPLVVPDALVGLAGPYDVRQVPEAAVALLGVRPEEDPARWVAADPLLLADRRPDLPVLLVHGDADDVVPPAQSRAFDLALRAAGHPTSLVVVPGAGHADAYSADVVGDLVAEWVTALGPRR